MRRILLIGVLIVLLAPACASPRLRMPFPDRPAVVVQWPVGGVATHAPPPPPPEPRPVPCREISRIPCDLVHCDNPGFDLVIVQCAGKAAAGKCEPNGGCAIGRDGN